jgi:hypothetical protein
VDIEEEDKRWRAVEEEEEDRPTGGRFTEATITG